jgi:cell fate regulator YaaT (PSP1 superfamily)
VNGNEQEGGRPIEPGKPVSESFVVIFSARRLDTFANETKEPVGVGDMVVVSADRGEDLGRVVAKSCSGDPSVAIAGTFLRKATPGDMEAYAGNREFEDRVMEFCAERLAVRKLDIRLSASEVQLDRKKIRVYFTADQRTDFRGIVRDLASKYHARIEMRQIGVRDDARKKDGVGVCGRQLCCSSFLSHFRSITLKTVREQDLSPNPAKVSGVCSRLMCCLDYEAEFYQHAARLYPKPGATVKVGKQSAEVTAVNIFRETVTLKMEDGSEKIMEIDKFHRWRKGSSGLDGGDPSPDTDDDISEEIGLPGEK